MGGKHVFSFCKCHIHPSPYCLGAPIAQWVKRWPVDQAVSGKCPAWGGNSPSVNEVPLHAAFHYYSAIVLIGLKWCVEKDVRSQVIHPSWPITRPDCLVQFEKTNISDSKIPPFIASCHNIHSQTLLFIHFLHRCNAWTDNVNVVWT